MLIVPLLFILTLVEAMGVRFFASRSKWRVTGTVAWVVCAHASVGWLLGGLAVGALLVLEREVDYVLNFVPYRRQAPWIGMVAGLLVFETLVYIGIRRCRFANRMPPAPDA